MHDEDGNTACAEKRVKHAEIQERQLKNLRNLQHKNKAVTILEVYITDEYMIYNI